jgi:hypothetical protein
MLLLVPANVSSPTCLSGALPLDDRWWACGAAPDCGGTAGPPISRATSWVVWATVWDPASEEHPQGATGEASEFRDAAVRAQRERLGGPCVF